MRQFVILLLITLCQFTAHAALPENILAVGQGVASPSTTTLVNMNRGLLGAENPAGVLYVDGFGFNFQMTKAGNTTTNGYELSVSNKEWGLGAGSYASCASCTAQQAVVVAGGFKWLGLGLRYQTVGTVLTYGLGGIINQHGKHRLGVHAEQQQAEDPANQVMKTGAGYTYHGNENIFNIEMTQSKTSTTSRSMNSVGYKKVLNNLEVSLTYEMDVEASTDHFWMGAGFKGSTFSLAMYAQYNTQMLAVLSAFF